MHETGDGGEGPGRVIITTGARSLLAWACWKTRRKGAEG
jgi:hypothetical protein